MGWILFQSHHYDEAIRELRSDLAVHQDDASTYWSCWFLGFALIANAQADEAIPVLEKALALSERNPAVIGVLVRAYAHAGRRTEALRLLDELRRRQQAGYVPSGTRQQRTDIFLARASLQGTITDSAVHQSPSLLRSPAGRPPFCGLGAPRRTSRDELAASSGWVSTFCEVTSYDCGRMTGKPEAMPPVDRLLPINALILTGLANFRVTGKSETDHELREVVRSFTR